MMTQTRFQPQQNWFQEPAGRKNQRLYELLRQGASPGAGALPGRAADGESAGAIEESPARDDGGDPPKGAGQ